MSKVLIMQQTAYLVLHYYIVTGLLMCILVLKLFEVELI